MYVCMHTHISCYTYDVSTLCDFIEDEQLSNHLAVLHNAILMTVYFSSEYMYVLM